MTEFELALLGFVGDIRDVFVEMLEREKASDQPVHPDDVEERAAAMYYADQPAGAEEWETSDDVGTKVYYRRLSRATFGLPVDGGEQ